MPAEPSRRRARGPLPSFAIVGYPNAGKSTLINRLVGGREAVVDSEPGVTRDRKELEAEWNGVRFTLIDTGGIDSAADDALASAVRDQARLAIDAADAILFVVDCRAGVGPGELEIASILRAAEPDVIVVANKVDGPNQQALLGELYTLGLGDPMPVSGAHGLGTGDLLDRLALLAGQFETPPEPDGEIVSVAIVGRPNVGKSSILNAITGQGRAIVSEIAGTTRDSIDTMIEVDGRRVRLVDTAGIRKHSKIAGTIVYYAQLRAERALARADVALLVCDACEGITSDDLRIGEKAMRAGCATLIAFNKWDINSGPDRDPADLADARIRLERRLRLRPRLITCSALRGRNVGVLLPEALRLADRRAVRIATPELNRFVAEAFSIKAPPQRRGKRLRAYYSAQVGERPPRIAIQVNDRKLLDRSWAFFLENRLREAYGFEGVPVVIDFIDKRRARERGNRGERVAAAAQSEAEPTD